MTQFPQHISQFLIGIPASGKSTFARWLQEQTQGLIICPDTIRAQLYGDAQIQGDWLEISVVIDQQIHKAIADNKIIIYDATNFQQTWRREFLEKYHQLNWVAWYLQIPLEDCWQRNQKRARQVPREIIQSMFQQLQAHPPTIQDGLDEIILVKSCDQQELKALKKQHLQYLCD